MRGRRDPLVVLAILVAAGTLVAAAAGVLAGGGEGGRTVTSPRAETFETYGEGVYRHDSAFKGGGFRGTDVVTLVLALPFLLVVAARHRRGSTRATLLLAGAFLYVLYVYASLALGAAYNDLFLLHVALFGASLFAFVLALRSVDLGAFDLARMPRRLAAIFLLASALATAAIWLADVVPPLVRGEAPKLEGYTTMVTHALDLGIIVPAVALAGVLVLRGDAWGYLLAVPLLVLEVSLLPMIAAQTAMQLAADVSFTTAEIAGPIGGFSVFAAGALVVLVSILGRTRDRVGTVTA